VQLRSPDSGNRADKAAAQGDVPVLFLQSNIIKDQLNNRLDCIEQGKGLIRFPDWLPDWFYGELTSETRTDKGWEKPKGIKNEAWDLCYYAIGLAHFALKLEARDFWLNPPSWASEWDTNSLVSKKNAPARFAQKEKPRYDFAKLGKEMAAA